MLSALRTIRATSLAFFNILILTFVPRPASSLPITALKRATDRDFLASSRYRVDDMLISYVTFGLATFVAIVGTWAWIMNRTIIVRFITRISWFLTAPITVTQEFFSYLRFTTLLRVATARVLDANDAPRGTSTRPRGGLSYPVSSVRRARYRLA